MKDNKDLPPPPPKPGSTDTDAFLKTGGKGVLCAKCNHLNKPGSTKCSVCESHLHIKCNDCGHRNERVYTRCQSCGRRLHKSVFEKMHRQVFDHRAKITPFQIVLLLVAVAVVYIVIEWVNKFRMPSHIP